MTDSSMQNTDQRIDQLLYALGNVEAPLRLEERVAARVARHSTMAGRRSSPRFFFAAYAAAALAVLIFAIAALHSHRKPETIAYLPQAPVMQPDLAKQPRALVTIHPAAHQPTQHRITEATPVMPTTSTDPNTIALAETLAPSHPAPPLPLTSQERLMLSILRSGEQEEIAALIPAERDALFARDQAAFNEYFALKNQPSNTGDQK